MAVQIAGNLQELIDEGAAKYIIANSDKFKSTTPGPKGDDGPRGPQGEGVHHMKGTSTTDPEGDFSTAGELDTYTFYADADELFPLAWFTVKNGEDPWRRAVDRGYRGTEEEFYTLLGSVEEYATIALESINITEENKQIVLAAASQVADDKLIVEEARDIAVEKGDLAKESADAVQIIFLGAKSVDPVVDNQGNPLVVGVMYYNEVIGQLKLWNGTEWTIAAFSAGGAVFSFNGRDGAITLTNTDVTIATGVDLQTKIPEIEGRISTNEDDIEDIQEVDALQDNRLDALEAEDEVINGNIDQIELDILNLVDENTTIKGRLDSAEDKLVAAEGRLDGIDTSITNINDSISEITTDIQELVDEDTAINNRIDGLVTRADTVDTRLDSIDSSIVDINTKDVEQDGRLDGLDTSVQALVDADVQINDEIVLLQDRVTDTESRLDSAEGDISDLTQRVEVLEGDTTVVGSVDNKIELRAQEGIYDDENGLGVDTIKEALDKLVLDLYKVKEW